MDAACSLRKLLDAVSRVRARQIDEEVVSLARRNFLRQTGQMLALPLAASLGADQLIELLRPKRTIFLPPPPPVWAVPSLGGYFYSRQLADVLLMNIQPIARFREGSGKPIANLTWNVHAS